MKTALLERHRNLEGKITNLCGWERIARHGYEILCGGKKADVATSGTYSFTFERSVGITYATSNAEAGELFVKIRDNSRKDHSAGAAVLQARQNFFGVTQCLTQVN